MSKKSLDAILGEFDPSEGSTKSSLKTGGPVTIWLPAEYKAAYDRLQNRTGRRFCKKVRELIQAAIDRTEAVAS